MKAPLTAAELEALGALADAAMEGPWSWEAYDYRGHRLAPGARLEGRVHSDGFPVAAHVSDLDAPFIAAAREAVPRLLADLAAEREARAVAEAEAAKLREATPCPKLMDGMHWCVGCGETRRRALLAKEPPR